MFGQTGQQKPSIFGSFGSTNATANTGGTSGTTMGTGTGTGLGLFGSTANKSVAPATGMGSGPGIFGTSGTTGTGLFGGAQNTNQNQNQQGGSTTGTGTNTNIFGNPGGTTGAGLFGSTITANQPASGGTNIFGQPQTSGTGTGANATSNIFGQPTGANTTTGTSTNIFGQPSGSGSTATGTSTNIFGQPPNTNASSQPQLTLFSSSQQQQKPSLFPSTAQYPFSSQLNNNINKPGMFGTTLGPGTSTSTRLGASLTPAQEPSLQQRIEDIYKAWDTNSANGACKFQYWFYNLVDPFQVSQYQTRPSGSNVDQTKWEKAMKDNPDPTCMIPVLAFGFDDLQKRVTAQTNASTQHAATLTKLRDTLTALSQAHTLQNTLRLQRLDLVQLQIRQRLMKLIVHLHLIIPTVRGSAIRPEEEKLRSLLENIEEELRSLGRGGESRGSSGGGISRMRAFMNELWAGVEQVQAMKRRERGALGNGDGGDGGADWQVVDNEGLQRIAKILMEEQQGLAYVTKLLQDNAKALEVIEEATKQVVPQAHDSTQKSFGGYRSASGLSTSFLLGR